MPSSRRPAGRSRSRRGRSSGRRSSSSRISSTCFSSRCTTAFATAGRTGSSSGKPPSSTAPRSKETHRAFPTSRFSSRTSRTGRTSGFAGRNSTRRSRTGGASSRARFPRSRSRRTAHAALAWRHRAVSNPGSSTRRLSDGLKAFGRQVDATPFMLFFTAFVALLSRWSGQDDILVSSPAANRQHVETEGLIGPFANPLLLRVDVSGFPTLRALALRVRDLALAAFSFAELPFEKLIEWQETTLKQVPYAPRVMFIYQTAFMQPVSAPERAHDHAAPFRQPGLRVRAHAVRRREGRGPAPPARVQPRPLRRRDDRAVPEGLRDASPRRGDDSRRAARRRAARDVAPQAEVGRAPRSGDAAGARSLRATRPSGSLPRSGKKRSEPRRSASRTTTSSSAATRSSPSAS